MSHALSEAEYRKIMSETLESIESAFETVDPDVAEASLALGALTIVYGGGHRCILSSQPSVRQLWLALASAGIAHHFDWDPTARVWRDDKGKGLELFTYLREFFTTQLRLSLKFGGSDG